MKWPEPPLAEPPLAGAIGAALFLPLMFSDVSAGGNHPIATSGGEWKPLVMETVLTGFVMLRAHTQHPAGLAHWRQMVAEPGPADTAGPGACGDGG